MARPDEELLDHLTRVSRLNREEARRVVEEVSAFHAETLEAFVARRHGELQAEGLKNPAIFDRLQHEVGERRFAAAPPSARQLRRLIYG